MRTEDKTVEFSLSLEDYAKKATKKVLRLPIKMLKDYRASKIKPKAYE